MRVIVLHPCTKSEDRRPSDSADMGDFQSRRCAALWLWPLTFRPLNGVTGHPCHGLHSCQFTVCPLMAMNRTDRQTDKTTVSKMTYTVSSGTLNSTIPYQTDGQTDGRTRRRHLRLMRPPCGGGGTIIEALRA